MARPKKQPKFNLDDELMAAVKELDIEKLVELEKYISSIKKGKVESEINALHKMRETCDLKLNQWRMVLAMIESNNDKDVIEESAAQLDAQLKVMRENGVNI